MVSLDIKDSEDESKSLELPDPKTNNPDLAFDRDWAFTLLDRALNALQSDETSKGRGTPFEILKPWLTGEQGDLAQTETHPSEIKEELRYLKQVIAG